MIAYHLASIPEQLGRVISQNFVVKTTRRSKVAPFDVLLDIQLLTYVNRTMHPLLHCDFLAGSITLSAQRCDDFFDLFFDV